MYKLSSVKHMLRDIAIIVAILVVAAIAYWCFSGGSDDSTNAYNPSTPYPVDVVFEASYSTNGYNSSRILATTMSGVQSIVPLAPRYSGFDTVAEERTFLCDVLWWVFPEYTSEDDWTWQYDEKPRYRWLWSFINHARKNQTTWREYWDNLRTWESGMYVAYTYVPITATYPQTSRTDSRNAAIVDNVLNEISDSGWVGTDSIDYVSGYERLYASYRADVGLLVQVLTGECYDDQPQDKRSVCEVIYNRLVSDKYDAQYVWEIVTAKDQFAFRNKSREPSNNDYRVAWEATFDFYDLHAPNMFPSEYLYFAVSKKNPRVNKFRKTY